MQGVRSNKHIHNLMHALLQSCKYPSDSLDFYKIKNIIQKRLWLWKVLTVHAKNEQKQQTHSVHMGFYSSFINKKTNFIPLKIPGSQTCTVCAFSKHFFFPGKVRMMIHRLKH